MLLNSKKVTLIQMRELLWLFLLVWSYLEVGIGAFVPLWSGEKASKCHSFVYWSCAELFQLIQTFSRCVLRCAQEEDLDELLSTRLVSFLMDHQQEILQVPTYLQVAVRDHLEYLKMAQVGAMRAVQIRLVIVTSEGGKMQINSRYFEHIDINYLTMFCSLWVGVDVY